MPSQILLSADDSEAELRSEVAESFGGLAVKTAGPALLETEFALESGQKLPFLVLARQWLPNARPAEGRSIREWAGVLLEAITAGLPESQPWALHVEPHYGARATHRIGARAWYTNRRQDVGQASRLSGAYGPSGQARRLSCLGVAPHPADSPDAAAGRRRCQLIRESVVEALKARRRHLLRQLRREPAPFTPGDSLVQLLLTEPEAGFISVAAAPVPFEQRHLLSPFPKGEVPVASDPAAPSRAFAKLIEAELRLGRSIRAGESCVDLGASPGSWTYAAVKRGANVVAVDRSPLREDLMASGQVRFEVGDAFRFEPSAPVDWLLCDVIAEPERVTELLTRWLQRGWCRHFVVTVKLKDASIPDVLAMLKRDLPPLARELFLTRLCANKKEVCAFGSAECFSR